MLERRSLTSSYVNFCLSFIFEFTLYSHHMIVCLKSHMEDSTDFEPEMKNFLIILKVFDEFEL